MPKVPNYSIVGIRAFECAARHQSFTKASREMCLTQGAVSKQVSALEERLGFILFNRLPRKLVLTREGKLLFDAVHSALSTIEAVIEEISSDLEVQKVVLSAPASLSIKWLIQRTGSFFVSNPGMELFIEADNKYIDLSEKEVDLVIRYGNANHPGYYVKYLMDEFLVPVCSPGYLRKPIANVSELEEYCLLDDRYSRKWDLWFKANRVLQKPKNKRLSFSRDDLMIEAAKSGQGIAMGLWHFVEDDIADGRLIRLFTKGVKTDKQYYIVCLKETALREDIKGVIEWLTTISKNSAPPTS